MEEERARSIVAAEQQQLFAKVENAVASLKAVHHEIREELNAARQRAKQQQQLNAQAASAEQQQQLNAQAASAAQQLLVAQVANVVASLQDIHRETREELNKTRQQAEQQASRESERRARRRERRVLSRLARGNNEEEAGRSGI